MSYDTQRRDEKIKELSDIVASRLACLDDSVKFAAATDLISVFARVTSPEKEEIRFHLITATAIQMAKNDDIEAVIVRTNNGTVYLRNYPDSSGADNFQSLVD